MTYNKWGQFGKDFEEGINFDRLRRERLQKAREALGRHGLGAIVATTLSNIRYITGSVGMAIEGAIFRYVVLPVEGEPILFEGPGELPRVRESAPWLDDFLIEVLSFPVGRYDDQVDSFSQFLTSSSERQSRLVIFDLPVLKKPAGSSWNF